MKSTEQHTLRLGFADHLQDVTITTPTNEPRPWDAKSELAIVGKPIPRVDAHLKVRGKATYTHDIALPDMLSAAILRCPYPCAILKKLDLSPAKRHPHVAAVLALAKEGDRLLFAGQDVAAVAAKTLEDAELALQAIDVRYEEQPFVIDTLSAMQEDAPVVHHGSVRARRTEGDEPGTKQNGEVQGNLRQTPSQTKGNIGRGLRSAEVHHEATYTTQVHTHSALETHSIVVQWEDAEHMTVWCSTQSIFSVRSEMAELFGLRPSNVRVLCPFLGGGFGAKFGASAPGSRIGYAAGELARLSKKPVQLLLHRHEEHICTGNRPDSQQRIHLGAKRDGTLTAIHVVSFGSAGIATGAGIGRNAFGIYTRCPHIKIESTDVFTHAGPGTAFRAPGHPQGAFGIELALNELAEKLHIDPLELRITHNEHPVRRHQFELGRTRFAWLEKRRRSAEQRQRGTRMRTGVGVAASIWGDYGRGHAVTASVSVDRHGGIEVRNGVQDIGGGIGTIIAQVVAEVLYQPVDRISVRIGDSEYGPSVGSGGSQTTSSVTPAVRAAAEKVKQELTQLAAQVLERPIQEIRWDKQGSVHVDRVRKSLSFLQLCQKMPGEVIIATGERPDTYGYHPMRFLGEPMYQIAGVQFAEVEVDTWTGQVLAKHILALHDCGRTMNPLTVHSQIHGGIILGTGYALMEQRIMDRHRGVMLNANLESYKCLGAKDVPNIEIELTEVYTGANNTGAVGIGEPATIPTAAAIAGAVYDALGVPIRSLPITPDRVLMALHQI